MTATAQVVGVAHQTPYTAGRSGALSPPQQQIFSVTYPLLVGIGVAAVAMGARRARVAKIGEPELLRQMSGDRAGFGGMGNVPELGAADGEQQGRRL